MTDRSAQVIREQQTREEIAERARAYMAVYMGMFLPMDDQEQNWIYSHLVEFALSGVLAVQISQQDPHDEAVSG